MIENKRQISILLPIKKGDRMMVYLQKRSADMKTLPGYFGFWGGGAENSETPEEALKREIDEELGVTLDPNKLELFNRYEFLRSVKFVYLFEPIDGWEDGLKIGEGDFGRWFTFDEAISLNNLILEDKVVLNDLERLLLNKPIR